MDKAPDAFRTISEVAEDLDLPQHVLRFWETRFGQIKPMKRGGGRRYYRPDDIDLLRGIRHLLYGEGYTIRGVQRILKDEGVKFVQTVWKTGAPQPAHPPVGDDESGEAAALTRPLPGRGSRDNGERERERERGRGLFGLLPTLLGGLSEPDPVRRDLEPGGLRIEEPIEEIGDALVDVPIDPSAEPHDPAADRRDGLAMRAAAAVMAGPGFAHAPGEAPAAVVTVDLAPDDLRKLQAAIFELGECRRLLDAALVDE